MEGYQPFNMKLKSHISVIQQPRFLHPGYHDVSLVHIPKVPSLVQAPEGASGTAAVLAAVAGCLDEFSLILKGATKSSVVHGDL